MTVALAECLDGVPQHAPVGDSYLKSCRVYSHVSTRGGSCGGRYACAKRPVHVPNLLAVVSGWSLRRLLLRCDV